MVPSSFGGVVQAENEAIAATAGMANMRETEVRLRDMDLIYHVHVWAGEESSETREMPPAFYEFVPSTGLAKRSRKTFSATFLPVAKETTRA